MATRPFSLHRYVDASEIAKLCASAGTPMSHADLEAAMAELDTDGSGRVEKVCVCVLHCCGSDAGCQHVHLHAPVCLLV